MRTRPDRMVQETNSSIYSGDSMARTLMPVHSSVRGCSSTPAMASASMFWAAGAWSRTVPSAASGMSRRSSSAMPRRSGMKVFSAVCWR